MNDKKNRVHLSEHQTTLNQTLQKQLVSLEFNARSLYADMSTRLEDYARKFSGYDSMARLEDYARKFSGYDSVARLEDYARKFSGYDSVARLEDYARKFSGYDSVARLEDYARKFSGYDSMARLANPAVDWQKQLNLLKSTQERLVFSNIIRGGLSIDSFPLLGPGQPYAPSPVPPTAVTDKVYEEIPQEIPAPSPELVPITNHKPVFIVHGHDHETRDDVSKFVSNWGLTPTILDKQPNKGRTIIEKFEDCADEASFAIVLLTPDDVGASVNDKAHLKYRARQNVIYEWGYFSGSIGREAGMYPLQRKP